MGETISETHYPVRGVLLGIFPPKPAVRFGFQKADRIAVGAGGKVPPGIRVTKLELLLSGSALEPKLKAFGAQIARLGKSLFAAS
jgi:hypothetical protein